MNKLFRLLVCACFAMFIPLTFAAPPPTINYQGFLTSTTGTPTNGAVVMTFKLYNAATGGAALYTEVQNPIAVTNGNFNAVIGAVSPITLLFDVPYWLTVTINADAEMSPRQPLASSPYAFRASSLDSVATIAGSQITGSITTATIPVANIIGSVAGPPGPQGIQGVTGMTGAAGAVGATGPAGPNDITGNLTMVNSTASAGNIIKGVNRFIHNFGSLNTFIGQDAGNYTMTGSNNTGSGAFALNSTTTGANNTANGSNALVSNTTGYDNTANGRNALVNNTTGFSNTASGAQALENNRGSDNTANGASALQFTTTGGSNTASGFRALYTNTTGQLNTANGYNALLANTTGFFNIAVGASALFRSTTGNGNIAIGANAGQDLITGSDNIYIGDRLNTPPGESGTIRIGQLGVNFLAYIRGIYNAPALVNGTTVYVEPDGRLGTNPSSRRFKDDITDMNAASSALMNLRPVTFHYKTDQNPSGRTLQYGLIAEEVAEVYPGLVIHSAVGEIDAVAYQHLPPMLLNEFQKQQRTIAAQALELAAQRESVLALARELRGLKATLGVE